MVAGKGSCPARPLVSQASESSTLWKCKQVTRKSGIFRIPTAPSPSYFGSKIHDSHGLDCQGQLWMFLLDNITPSCLPAPAQDHFYKVCLDTVPIHWELLWDNFMKEGAYKSKPTHVDSLSHENTMLILNSHPETSTFSKCVASFESLLWISVLFTFLDALTFPSFVMFKDSDCWQPPLFLSFIWSTGDWKCKSSALHSHMSLCITISPSLWNLSSIAGDGKAQQNILTGLVDIFNCLRAAL